MLSKTIIELIMWGSLRLAQIEELREAYTDNSGKKWSPVYDSTALTEICEES